MEREKETAAGLLAAFAVDYAAVVERVRASVVEVRAPNHGAGAGTVWSAGGLIVTNHHVTPGAAAEVILADGRSFGGRVVARDSTNDLAVLDTRAVDVPTLPLRDPRTLRVGELVLAVGHPFGERGAVTVGIISSASSASGSRDATTTAGGGAARRELIQADVLLRPGNSGGPLTDAQGRVVGINAMVNGGLALAVPSTLVQRLLSGRRGRRLLGIAAQPVKVDTALAQRSGVGAGDALMVTDLSAGGAAERAGVLPGDVLIALDGVLLADSAALRAALDLGAAPTSQLRILRGGRLHEVVVQFDPETVREAA